MASAHLRVSSGLALAALAHPAHCERQNQDAVLPGHAARRQRLEHPDDSVHFRCERIRQPLSKMDDWGDPKGHAHSDDHTGAVPRRLFPTSPQAPWVRSALQVS